MALAGWVFFGPRRRTATSLVAPMLLWPALWLVYTLVVGAVTTWYPYPFVDVSTLGSPATLVNRAGVCVLLLALALILVQADRRLPGGSPRS